MGLNKVTLIGNVGKEPEVRVSAAGLNVCSFSLATTEYWYKDGVKEEKTEWHRLVAFGKTAETLGKWLTKGKQIYVEGKLSTRSYESNGEKRYITEVIVNDFQFLGGNKKDNDDNTNETSEVEVKPTKKEVKKETKGFKSTTKSKISTEDEINDILGEVPDVPF